MTDIAISIQNLNKCYHIYDNPSDRLKQFVAPRLQRLTWQSPKQYYREFWALKDVSFEIKKGETVGIIGRNGSGKSTLLQMICGTLTPTSGEIQTNGRIAALLELGSGFNPEFTGRENVYMNAVILGLSLKEVEERFDDIAAFADIGEFIEQPVKTYSSGMFVRLAFAVNILSSPDIMIVDEALAVGDMNFQAKCMTALTRIQDNGAAVLFVSHDVGAVKSLCSRGIYLERGTVKIMGNAPDVAEEYIKAMREEMNAEFLQQERPISNNEDKQALFNDALPKQLKPVLNTQAFDKRVADFRYGTGGARILDVQLLDIQEQPINFAHFNQQVLIRVYFQTNEEKEVSVNFLIQDTTKMNIMGSGFPQAGHPLMIGTQGVTYCADYKMHLPLQEGNYSIRVHITSPSTSVDVAEFLDDVQDAVIFQMERWEKARIWSKVFGFPELSISKLA
jgi:lipopolysaccharide transport system ATP-binding protein